MKRKVIIIGGGPIGLYAASKLADYLLIEASSTLGGQLTRLYPEKEIVDIPGISSITAKEYIELLKNKIDLSKVHLNEKAIDIIIGKPIIVKTNKDEYECDNLIVSTGLGFSTPRKLGLEGEDECSNILYHLSDYNFLANKKVTIFGGGDSALDWAKLLSKISDGISLIHRRREFRGNKDTIKDSKNLKLYLPYVPYSLDVKDNLAKSITIKNVENDELITLDVDYILVNYGNIAEITNFPLEKENNFFIVDNNFRSKDNIFVVGDASSYNNKKRRIAPGNAEVDTIIKFIN